MSDSDYSGRIEFTGGGAYSFCTRADIEKICRTGRKRKYRAVCVPTSGILQARALLEDSEVRVCALIGFPYGTADADAKRYEVEVAIDADAQEIELMPSLGKLKDGEFNVVLREIRDVVEAADERPVRVVIEANLWTDKELGEITRMILDSGAQFISANSGWHGSISAPEQIEKLVSLVGPGFGVKGTVGEEDAAEDLVDAGASLVGLVESEPVPF
jgi:deoxyribose-phosphate aldolase